MRRLQVWFSGTVQGVGFRFTTVDLAKHYPVRGYVKNLPDGRVELVAEGEASDLEAFLKSVTEHNFLASYIRKTDVSWCDARGGFRSFGIAY